MSPDPGVYTYRRVATNSDNGLSLAVQADQLTIAAATLKLYVVKDFFDISSGMSADRKALPQLLDCLALGEAQGVLVTSIDRISRSLRDCITFMQTLQDFDCRLYTIEGLVDIAKYLADGPVWLKNPQEKARTA